MPEQSINEQTRQMMGMPTSGDPAIIDPTTGRPYTADASMRQQEEITRQAEVKEEFASEQRLQLPKDLEEEIEEEIRPKARPEGLPNIYEKKTAIDKTLEYGYLLKERQPGAKGKTKIVTGLDERNPAHQKIIKAFFDSAVGGDTGFDPTKQAWCAAFVNHILTEMGADLIESKDPYKRLRANEYKTYGKPVDLENIQEGDIVVFDFDKDGTADHVTFYAGGRITSQGEGQYINVIGGNQGGGEVSIRENEPGYTLDNVAAIRRVTYDGDAYEIAQSHKDSDPVFKTFLPEEHEDYALNLQGNYNEGGDVSAQTDNLFGYTDEAVTKEVDKYKENVNTELSFKDAATFVAEATPIIGDALAAKEVYDELQKDDPNYLLVGALGGAALVGLIPGLGDAAAKAIKTGAKKALNTAKRIEVDPNALGSMGGNIDLKGGVGTGLPKIDMIADTPAGINNKTVTQSAVDLINEPAFGKGFAEKLQKVAAENSIAVGDKTFSPMQVYTELKDRVGSDDFTVVPSKSKATNSPDEPKNYAYRTDNPATKGYEGGEEWLEGKQKTAEDRAKNSSEENSTGKLLSGSITGYMGQDFKRPLFLSTEMLSKLKGANDEKRYVGEGRYDLLRKRVDKEGFDPEQKYSSEDDYGNAIVIGVNHKGEAFIIEGNTRVAVAKDLDVTSIRAEVKYYNGAEEVDGPYSPQNIIQYADKPKDFNKGGAVMNEQMEMAFMNQGGLKDDGMKRDPVSGNEVPNGSMAKEVRDDISAQLSEGEYVVPADVVRYLGVKHFEDLRNKAKSGLQKMEANGRIGGEPVPVGGPQAAPMPQPPTPYMAEGGDLSPDEMNEIKMLMNQGGMVADAAEGTDVPPYANVSPYSSFTPTSGFSWEQNETATAPELPTEAKTLYGPNGEVVTLTLPKDQQKYDELIAQGYTETQPVTPTVRSGGDGSSNTPSTTPGTSFTGFKNWGAEIDWTDSESVKKFVTEQYNMPDPALRKGAGVAGLLGAGPLAAVGTVGSIFMAGQVLDTVADLRTSVMIAKAYGNTEGAAIAQAKLDTALKGAPSYVTSMLGDTLASGTMQFAGHVSGASGLDDLPSNIDEWTKNDFTRFQSATGKKAPVKAAANKTKKAATPSSYDTTTKQQIKQMQSDRSEQKSAAQKAAEAAGSAAIEAARKRATKNQTDSAIVTSERIQETMKKSKEDLESEYGSGLNKGGLMKKKRKK